VHFNGLFEGRPPPSEAEQTPDEQAWRRVLNAYNATQRDYASIQNHKPQTVAFALTDNPLGAAAWIVEKLKAWSDSPEPFEPAFTKDQVLTNIMIYLVTNTMGTSIWMYLGGTDEPGSSGYVMVPTGYASFPRENPNANPPRQHGMSGAKLQHRAIHEDAAWRPFCILGTTRPDGG
jgi:hypothetical protein